MKLYGIWHPEKGWWYRDWVAWHTTDHALAEAQCELVRTDWRYSRIRLEREWQVREFGEWAVTQLPEESPWIDVRVELPPGGHVVVVMNPAWKEGPCLGRLFRAGVPHVIPDAWDIQPFWESRYTIEARRSPKVPTHWMPLPIIPEDIERP